MGMEFRPLSTEEQAKMGKALRINADTGQALKMSPRDTSFLGTAEADETIEQTINAIKSIPCHYARGA